MAELERDQSETENPIIADKKVESTKDEEADTPKESSDFAQDLKQQAMPSPNKIEAG